MQIYSTALLEKSSMLGQCQIIYQVMYNEIIDTYVWGKACTNRWVFNSVLNEIIDWDFLIKRGRLFQILGAAQEKARSPSVTFVLEVGILRSHLSFELRSLCECAFDLSKINSEI